MFERKKYTEFIEEGACRRKYDKFHEKLLSSLFKKNLK